MNTSKAMTLILALLIVGALGISVLLAPESAPSGYWLSIAWVAFLIIANWWTSAAIFAGHDDKSSKLGSVFGSLPFVSSLVFVGSLISVAAIFFFWSGYLSVISLLVIQILLFVGCCVLGILALIAPNLQNEGGESAISQGDLIRMIEKWLRASSTREVAAEAEILLNYVKFQMPHISKLEADGLTKLVVSIKSNSKPSRADVQDVLRAFKEL